MLLHFTGFVMNYAHRKSLLMYFVRSFVLMFPGVVCLLTLSGLLVAASFDRILDNSNTESEATSAFLFRRAKRIFPSLWVCTAINVVIILLLGGWKHLLSLVLWAVTQIAGIAWTPGVFKTFATGSLNGALWTVFVQIQLYLLTAFLYPTLRNKSKKEWERLLIIALLINLFCGVLEGLSFFPGFLFKLLQRTFFPYAFYYLAGMYMHVHRDSMLPMLQSKRNFAILLVAYIILYRMPVMDKGFYTGVATTVLVPPIIIAEAQRLGPRLSRIPDLTYELFLSHWIALNILFRLQIIQKWPILIALILFLVLSFAFAFCVRFLTQKIFENNA